ncbi:efflux RND transporter permease subunit [Paenibacillus sp. IB182496]|uniref:Efflux RND transporter permease subunit n=1 Tax=Paenibacillus sabuli TaxID=2772509 RepID=A0A927GSZ3_9BACL|nr:efflux RND transporter permease subunit [Paenibacillus sabuli]MBD2846796.1 efflux RND transporter permease subunit [Paenibacillus sabuli]
MRVKSTIRFSLKNKFALWIMTLIVTVGGLYSGLNMKMETMPDITIPIVSVTTIYPGATPEEVMEELTLPIEQRTRNLSGVTNVSSTSMENVSSIVIEYNYDKDMEKAVTEVNEVLAEVSLPDGAQESDVSRISLNAFPVISLSLADESRDLAELTELVESSVLPRVQGLPGVASVQVSGQHVQEAQLAFDNAKMAELGLSQETVRGLIQGAALSVPLGIHPLDGSEKALLVDGNIVTLEDLQNLPIPVIPSGAAGGAQSGAGQQGGGAAPDGGMSAPQAGDGAGATAQEGDAAAQQQDSASEQAPQAGAMTGLPTVPLGDIADIEIVGSAESISRTNGNDSIGISVVKAADANTVDVVNAVKEETEAIASELNGLIVDFAFDQGEPIEDSVHTMLNKALMGSLFAIIIILLFLRDIRSTLIAVVSIPLSILIALLVLGQMDVTLNVMTLGAMTVAIGRVVDDSIVVIENIYRRMSLSGERLKGSELILESTREMFVPILASTIVTIAVFVPLGLVEGPVGEIFMPFALTIVFALLASLLVAVTVVPMLAHMLFRKFLTGERPLKKVHEDKPGRMAEGYKGILNWALNHKLITFGGAVVLLAASFLLTPLIGFSFLPADEQKMMVVTYNPAPGESQEDVEAMALEAEQAFMTRDGIEMQQYSVGGANPMNPGASKQALFYLNYASDYKGFEDEKEAVIALLQDMGGEGEWKQQNFAGGGLGGSGLALQIYGPDMASLEPVVQQVMDKMAEHDELTNIDTSLSQTYDQYTLVADQEKLAQYGLAAGQVAMALSPARERPVLTTIEQDGKRLNVYLEVDQESYSTKEELGNVTLNSPLGMEVAIKDVMTIEEGESPNTITRQNDRVYTEVSADVTSANVAAVSSELSKELDALELPEQVEISFGGVTAQMNDAFADLAIAMLAAVAVVYLVLVITFGGGLTPLTILFSLPFTIIGGLVALWIAGETISVTALIGALMLIGIVVTNAIVLIDRVIHKQKEGLSVREALLEAAGTRLRPILMTALATIGALLPLAFGFESGGLISKGLGVTVIGGLASSTLLTLLIVPIVYEFLARFRKAPKHGLDE